MRAAARASSPSKMRRGFSSRSCSRTAAPRCFRIQAMPAGHRALVLRAVGVGGGGVHQPVQHQAPRPSSSPTGPCAPSSAPRSTSSAADLPDPFGAAEVALDADVALGVGHDRQLPAHPHLEAARSRSPAASAAGSPRRERRARRRSSECRPWRRRSWNTSSQKFSAPRPSRRPLFRGQRLPLDLPERPVDVGAGRHEHARALVGRGVKVGEAQRRQGLNHAEGGLQVAGAVVQAGEKVAMKVDKMAHGRSRRSRVWARAP